MTADKKRKMDESANKNEKQSIPHLPEDIIIDILLRLPARSISKFRCVSKPWNVLFNNQKLIGMIKNNFSIMLIDRNYVYSIDNESLCPSSSLMDVIDSRVEKIDHPFVLRHGFVGCCSINGLFCIRTNNGLISFWNPSTGDYKVIPNLPEQFQIDNYLRDLNFKRGYGFGYDSKSDDYKFVCIRSYSNNNQAVTEIYSLRSNSWKQTEHISPLLCSHFHGSQQQYGVFCHGALHWLSYCFKGVIALDMADENVREISRPENSDFTKSGDSYNRCIDVLDGCLCMLYCHYQLGFEVWLMQDYGKRESWTKLYSISKLTSLEVKRFDQLRRIKLLKTGELLLEVCYYCTKTYGSREALVLYDPKNETSKFLKFNKDIWSSNSFHAYVKSSVSVSTGANGN